MNDELLKLATEAALEAGCCTRSTVQPNRLIAIEDVDDEEMAVRELAAWNALAAKAKNTISEELDPDREIQPALIYVLQSVEER